MVLQFTQEADKIKENITRLDNFVSERYRQLPHSWTGIQVREFDNLVQKFREKVLGSNIIYNNMSSLLLTQEEYMMSLIQYNNEYMIIRIYARHIKTYNPFIRFEIY